jgi:hypothetical protein
MPLGTTKTFTLKIWVSLKEGFWVDGTYTCLATCELQLMTAMIDPPDDSILYKQRYSRVRSSSYVFLDPYARLCGCLFPLPVSPHPQPTHMNCGQASARPRSVNLFMSYAELIRPYLTLRMAMPIHKCCTNGEGPSTPVFMHHPTTRHSYNVNSNCGSHGKK